MYLQPIVIYKIISKLAIVFRLSSYLTPAPVSPCPPSSPCPSSYPSSSSPQPASRHNLPTSNASRKSGTPPSPAAHRRCSNRCCTQIQYPPPSCGRNTQRGNPHSLVSSLSGARGKSRRARRRSEALAGSHVLAADHPQTRPADRRGRRRSRSWHRKLAAGRRTRRLTRARRRGSRRAARRRYSS